MPAAYQCRRGEDDAVRAPCGVVYIDCPIRFPVITRRIDTAAGNCPGVGQPAVQSKVDRRLHAYSHGVLAVAVAGSGVIFLDNRGIWRYGIEAQLQSAACIVLVIVLAERSARRGVDCCLYIIVVESDEVLLRVHIVRNEHFAFWLFHDRRAQSSYKLRRRAAVGRGSARCLVYIFHGGVQLGLYVHGLAVVGNAYSVRARCVVAVVVVKCCNCFIVRVLRRGGHDPHEGGLNTAVVVENRYDNAAVVKCSAGCLCTIDIVYQQGIAYIFYVFGDFFSIRFRTLGITGVGLRTDAAAGTGACRKSQGENKQYCRALFYRFHKPYLSLWSYVSAKLAAAAAVSFAEYNLILRADPMKCNPGRRNLAFRGAWG